MLSQWEFIDVGYDKVGEEATMNLIMEVRSLVIGFGYFSGGGTYQG